MSPLNGTGLDLGSNYDSVEAIAHRFDKLTDHRTAKAIAPSKMLGIYFYPVSYKSRSSYLPAIFASDICQRYLPAIFASDICQRYLPAIFASDICQRMHPMILAIAPTLKNECQELEKIC
jgi:hypothetical protein